MAAISEVKETITWLGRVIVAAIIVATYNKVDADHDKNLVQDGLIADHEKRIGKLEGNKHQEAIVCFPVEGLIPDNDLKVRQH
jgi:hypothetical protein